MKFTKLYEDSEHVLLLCDECVAARPMHDRPKPVAFRQSSLYAWLNGEFAEKHLTAEERSRLIEVTLLSAEEAEAYLPEKGCRPGETAGDGSAYRIGGNGNCWWWLRSKGFAEDFFQIVDFAGHICTQGTYVTLDTDGVRPALRLRKEA